MFVMVLLPGRDDDDFDDGVMPQFVQAHMLRVGRKFAGGRTYSPLVSGRTGMGWLALLLLCQASV
jgi:hypothetical protein